MTTRKRRQAERIKAYGLILNHHRCGRGIFVGADGRFFAAENRDRGRIDAAREAITVCPECGRDLAPEHLNRAPGDNAWYNQEHD
jgi:hypothetical protein